MHAYLTKLKIGGYKHSVLLNYYGDQGELGNVLVHWLYNFA